MKENRVVVMGVSNSNSIAWMIANSLYLADDELFFTYENEEIGEILKQLIESEKCQIPFVPPRCRCL